MKTNRKGNKSHIKKGDTVVLLTGKQKGESGKVMSVYAVKNKFTGAEQKRAIVEGLNMCTKHTKPNQANPQGAIVQTEAGVHISNLALLDPKTQKPTRIGRKRDENNKWVRISKISGEVIK